MKRMLQLIAAFLLAASPLFSQSKGAAPIPNPSSPIPAKTRAVVVGISDYRDDKITDLRFADRDAQVFHDYLRSAAGGEVPEANIRLLTNEKATQAAILDALYWLNRESKKGDEAVLYFSGHGDVEKQTLWQLGYLLAYDTPFNNYPNNAVDLEYLNKIITTMSVGAEARVIVVMDACRSGKLAGADNLGPSLTAEQLAKRTANEVRIMSCKSDQLSLEGEEWGGGRGLFSFFFVNGLKGLADEEADSEVALSEMESFLKTNVRKSIRDKGLDNRQDAVFVGDELFTLSKVDGPTLAAVNAELNATPTDALVAVASVAKGMVDAAAPVSAGPVEASTTFFTAIDFGRLLDGPMFQTKVEKGGDGLLAYLLKWLDSNQVKNSLDAAEKEGLARFLKASEAENLRPETKRQLAVALHDWAQEVVNGYLRGDAGELAKRCQADQAKVYAQYPLLLKAAMQLLPPDHPLQHPLQVKLHYFTGVGIKLVSLLPSDAITDYEMLALFDGKPPPGVAEAVAEEQKALALDSTASYVHNELGVLNLMKNKVAEAARFFEKAVELSPTWAVAYSNLCGAYVRLGQLDKARAAADRALALQPDYFGTRLNRGRLFEKENDWLSAETEYREAASLNSHHYLPFEWLALALLQTTRYEEAERQFEEAESRKKGALLPTAMPTFGQMKPPTFAEDRKAFAEPLTEEPERLFENPKTAEEFFLTGRHHFDAGRWAEAVPFFRQAVKMRPANADDHYFLGLALQRLARFGEAEICFQRLQSLRPGSDEPPLLLANLYLQWKRPDKEEEIYRQILRRDTCSEEVKIGVFEGLLDLLDRQGRFLEKEKTLLDFQRISPKSATKRLGGLYDEMVERYPADADWLFKKTAFDFEADRFPAHQKRAVERLEKVLELDTAFSARAFIHEKAGRFYLEQALKYDDGDRDAVLKRAVGHFQKAAALRPEEPSAQFGLVAAQLELFDYPDALSILDSLDRNGRIDFENLVKLADLKTRSGRFAEADNLLKKAESMQPEAVAGLSELRGKWHLLQSQPREAVGFFEKELALEQGVLNGSICYTVARLHARSGEKEAALEWLKKALENGFTQRRVLENDPDWNGLREDDGFLGLFK